MGFILYESGFYNLCLPVFGLLNYGFRYLDLWVLGFVRSGFCGLFESRFWFWGFWVLGFVGSGLWFLGFLVGRILVCGFWGFGL